MAEAANHQGWCGAETTCNLQRAYTRSRAHVYRTCTCACGPVRVGWGRGGGGGGAHLPAAPKCSSSGAVNVAMASPFNNRMAFTEPSLWPTKNMSSPVPVALVMLGWHTTHVTMAPGRVAPAPASVVRTTLNKEQVSSSNAATSPPSVPANSKGPAVDRRAYAVQVVMPGTRMRARRSPAAHTRGRGARVQPSTGAATTALTRGGRPGKHKGRYLPPHPTTGDTI
jgi:hypothetical protein